MTSTKSVTYWSRRNGNVIEVLYSDPELKGSIKSTAIPDETLKAEHLESLLKESSCSELLSLQNSRIGNSLLIGRNMEPKKSRV